MPAQAGTRGIVAQFSPAATRGRRRSTCGSRLGRGTVSGHYWQPLINCRHGDAKSRGMALMTTIEQPAGERDKNAAGDHSEPEPSIMRRLTPELGFDLVRIYLGLGLAVRGVLFLLDPSWISEQLHTAEALVWPARLIALGHLGAGLLLALGYYTRLAAAVQLIPVLGAVLVVHRREGLVSPGQSLEFAALVFAMLLFYAAFGAGRLSLDQRLRRKSA